MDDEYPPSTDEVREVDATPDEAFELGRVQGYDEAITDAVDWARSQSGLSADQAADYIEEKAAMVEVQRPESEATDG